MNTCSVHIFTKCPGFRPPEDQHRQHDHSTRLKQKFIDQLSLNSILFANEPTIRAMRRLSTGIRSEKRVVRRFRRCANVIKCTDTNLETWHWLGLLMDESLFGHPFSELGRFHPHWKFALASNFPSQSSYLDFPKILNTVVYAVRRWPKRRYAEHDCTRSDALINYNTYWINKGKSVQLQGRWAQSVPRS